MLYTLPQIIEQSAKKFPNQEAFRCGNKGITYKELATKSTQLAKFLVESGIKRGDRVGILLNRCLDTAIAVYGILKAGAVYVPLDPFMPVNRIDFVLKDCGITCLITNAAQRKKLTAIHDQGIVLKNIIGISANWKTPTTNWETIFEQTPTLPTVRILEQDLAYILYTSGSTGTPKGIMHTHYSGLAYAKLSADLYELTEKDKVGNFPPLHFDASTFGYFSAPLVGATTIIINDAYTKFPASLTSLIEKEKITVWYSVPLALVQIAQRGVMEKRDLSSMRWILYGGEPFPMKHLRKLLKHLPNAIFSNVYGPTEVNQCTYYNFQSLPEAAEAVPLGDVWNNTEVLVVDEADNILMNGEVGELLVRSATRMAGYWNKPELTAKSFYRKKLVTGVDQIFYRTGDLVYWRSDGNLMFLGRKDRQIKIRGYRVELDEVEAAILTYKGIEEAVTFVLQQEEEKIMQAAIILNSSLNNLLIDDLRKYLNNHLPSYAIPHKITILQDFPRTSTGKVSRQILKQQIIND